MRFRVFHKFLLTISILTLFPLIWLGSSLVRKSEEAVKTSTKEIHLNFIESVKASFVFEVDKYASVVDVMDRLFHTISDWEKRQIIIDGIIKSFDGVVSISIASPTGSEVIKISLQKITALSTIPSYLKEKAMNNGFAVEVSSYSVVFVYYTAKYFVVFEIEAANIYRKIFSRNIGKTSFLLFNSSGVKYTSDGSDIPEEIFSELVSSKIISSFLSSEAAGVFEIRLKKHDYVGAVSCYIRGDICFGSIQKKSDAYSYVDLARKQAIFIIIVAILISLCGSYLLSKTLTGPILKFIEAAKRVADKDFSVRVNVNTSDELEDLRDTFNRMIEEIEKYSNLQIERIVRERRNLEAVMYSTEDGMIMVDTNWNIQLINRKALSLTQIAEDEDTALGKNIIEGVANPSIKQALETIKDGKVKVEFKIERGSAVEYYRAEKNEIRMKDNESVFGHLITFYDITYDKQLEKIKDDFLHSITHDLRNPVSAIKGFSEFLLKEIAGPINQNQKNMIISIDRAAFRLLQMINNILDIAKMEAGMMEISLERFNVVELINRCVELMRILGEKKNIRFVIDAPSEIMISADAGLIERVYINLIGNAIKFTPQNGTITIAASVDGEMFKSWVEDTGEGIPLEYIDKVFKKFEQVKGQKGGGTGLGLTICKYIVESHLGRIWAEWRANKGAKFVFTFPLNLKKDEFGRIFKE